MIFLDTDHVSILTVKGSTGHDTLIRKLKGSTEPIAVPIVSVEEQCKGWLAKIHRERDIYLQISPCERLAELFRFFEDWRIVLVDERAADRFVDLRSQKIRIGTQDLKIAAIALANDALLLLANLRDFQKVPGLRVENWLAA
jgi:tRNA(fMet)-specific endonuclease VapC